MPALRQMVSGGGDQGAVGVPGDQIAMGIAAARIGIGASFVAFPRLALKVWPGAESERPIARSLARSLGGRDLAIGLGLLFAVRHQRGVRGWLEAGMLADAVDAASIATAWKHLPRARAAVVLAGAVGAVVAARRLVGTFD